MATPPLALTGASAPQLTSITSARSGPRSARSKLATGYLRDVCVRVIEASREGNRERQAEQLAASSASLRVLLSAINEMENEGALTRRPFSTRTWIIIQAVGLSLSLATAIVAFVGFGLNITEVVVESKKREIQIAVLVTSIFLSIANAAIFVGNTAISSYEGIKKIQDERDQVEEKKVKAVLSILQKNIELIIQEIQAYQAVDNKMGSRMNRTAHPSQNWHLFIGKIYEALKQMPPGYFEEQLLTQLIDSLTKLLPADDMLKERFHQLATSTNSLHVSQNTRNSSHAESRIDKAKEPAGSRSHLDQSNADRGDSPLAIRRQATVLVKVRPDPIAWREIEAMLGTKTDKLYYNGVVYTKPPKDDLLKSDPLPDV